MATIWKLFGRSPFGPLQRHMEQVSKCVAKMRESLDAFEARDWQRVESCVAEVSQLEHQADQIKDDIRARLRQRAFLPVDRNRLLEILRHQDNLADTAENICVLLTFKQLPTVPGIEEDFQRFLDINIEAFLLVEGIVRQLDELMESGFGGPEAERVTNMVQDVAYAEHRADTMQRQLLKGLFARESEMTAGDLYLWLRLTKEIADLSNQSENLAKRILTALELK